MSNAPVPFLAAPPVAASHLPRIRRISRRMVVVCQCLLVALPLALLWHWATASEAELAVRSNLPPGAIQSPLLLWQRLAGAAASAVPLGLMLLGVWQARQCFALFASGQVFTARATAYLRSLAGWVAWAALAAMLSAAVVSVLLTLGNPPGTRHLAVGLGSDHVLTLFFAALVWLIADVVGQGELLAHENEQFV